MFIYGLLLGLLLQGSVAAGPSDVAHLFQTAHDTSDIRSLGPFVLDAKITATGTKSVDGKYRLVYVSDRQWREEILIGSEYLSLIQKDDRLFTKSTSPEVEDLLSPFQQIGNYAVHFSDRKGVDWKIKSTKIAGKMLQCARAGFSGWSKEYCFLDGVFVGDGEEINYADFQELDGKKYPLSWQKKTAKLKYAGRVERIAKANVDPKYFDPDGTFESQPSIPCAEVRVMDPMLTSQERPIYPPVAKQARVQGTVAIKVLIDESGVVQNPRILSGHRMLTTSALDAVRHWRYEPQTCEGKAVPVSTTITVNYSLSPY